MRRRGVELDIHNWPWYTGKEIWIPECVDASSIGWKTTGWCRLVQVLLHFSSQNYACGFNFSIVIVHRD